MQLVSFVLIANNVNFSFVMKLSQQQAADILLSSQKYVQMAGLSSGIILQTFF